MATATAIRDFVNSRIKDAIRVADNIRLQKNFSALAESMIADVPPFKELHIGTAKKLWASILFMDMRGSSARALRVGARDTYVTMHALLPLMAYLISDHNGYIVGFRGDGIFGAFGISDDGDNGGMEEPEATKKACLCGQTVVEAVEDILNPLLAESRIEGDVRVGAGVDIGEVVITRIGLERAYEITAYGNAVNRASKLAGVADQCVMLSSRADEMYPAGPNGKVRTTAVEGRGDAYEIHFPGPQIKD